MKNQFTKNQIKWLEALESGKYKQATKNLKTSSGFCCLGVACEISKLSDWDENGDYLGFGGALPNKVQDHLSLYDAMGEPKFFSKMRSLTYMNDTGSSFKEIAAHLRNYPEQYFTNFEVQS